MRSAVRHRVGDKHPSGGGTVDDCELILVGASISAVTLIGLYVVLLRYSLEGAHFAGGKARAF